MKLFSTICLLLAVACQAGQYYGAYSEGALRVWCTTMLVLFIASLTIQLYVLPPPRDLIVLGLRDRLLKVCPPDDLRRFARQVRTDLPLIGLSHGILPDLKPDEAAKYQKLVDTYPFMKWGLEQGDGPSLYDLDGKIEVNWGGPADGHWGFTVAADGQKLPPDREAAVQIIRLADDLYFFRRN